MEFIDFQPVESPGAETPPPPSLSEGDIKAAFIPYLREFYKYRYAIQPGTVSAATDEISEDGYVADGRLTFLKKDDPDSEKREFFTATFEATSREKVGEVRFSVNLSYLVWDCVSFAAMFTAGVYILSYILRTHFLWSLGPAGNIGFIVGVYLMLFSAWFFVMRGWKKYRYIYAVEQFKQYFADEQWVALGEDVFLNPKDSWLEELKNQCVFNGFGLAIVHFDKTVRPIATPSRLGIFGKNRKMVEWVTQSKIYKNTASGLAATARMREKIPGSLAQMANRLWRPVQFYAVKPLKNMLWRVLVKPFGQTATVYDRYMRGQTTQKFMTLLAAFALAFFVRNTLKHKEIIYADEAEYSDFLNRKLARPNPEDYRGYVRDEERPGAVPKQYPVGSEVIEDEDDGVQTLDLSGGDDDEWTAEDEGIEPAENQSNTKILKPAKPPVRKPAAAAPQDVCALVRGKNGWLVQDAYFADKADAGERLAALKHRGLPCFVVWNGCFSRSGKGYHVFIGQVYGAEKTGRAELSDFQKALKRYGLEKTKLVLRRIQ